MPVKLSQSDSPLHVRVDHPDSVTVTVVLAVPNCAKNLRRSCGQRHQVFSALDGMFARGLLEVAVG